jgi:hypothetical protein
MSARIPRRTAAAAVVSWPSGVRYASGLPASASSWL